MSEAIKSTSASEQVDDRAPSRLSAALGRIQARLDQRVVNKAHDEAIAEGQQRDFDAQNDAYTTYEDNVALASVDLDDAYAMNDKFDTRLARREKIDETKDKVRDAGQRALGALKSARVIALGAGFLAGEYGARKVKGGAESLALGAMYAKDAVVDTAQAINDKGLALETKFTESATEGIEAVKSAHAAQVERENDWIADQQETGNDIVKSIRERLARRKQAALARKDDRYNHRQSIRRQKEAISRQRESYIDNLTPIRRKVARGIGKTLRQF